MDKTHQAETKIHLQLGLITKITIISGSDQCDALDDQNEEAYGSENFKDDAMEEDKI